MNGIRLKNSRAFTLIELLVVIAIIAILASILFPVFTNARKAGIRAQCLSGMKQLSSAVMLYKNDYKDYFPMGGYQTASSDLSTQWQNAIYRYLKTEKVLRCPAARVPAWDPKNPMGNNAQPVTYLYNAYLGAEMTNPRLQVLYPKSQPESLVVKPADCIMFMEGSIGNSAVGRGTDPFGNTRSLWLRLYTFMRSPNNISGRRGQNYPSSNPPGNRWHGGGGNVAFVDGHVVFHKYNDDYDLEATLPWDRHVPLQSDSIQPIGSNPWYRDDTQ